MTPTTWIVIAVAVVVVLGYVWHYRTRAARAQRSFDVGAVSTRWLSELRRDDPWTSS